MGTDGKIPQYKLVRQLTLRAERGDCSHEYAQVSSALAMLNLLIHGETSGARRRLLVSARTALRARFSEIWGKRTG